MSKRLALLTALSLSWGLSCAIWHPPVDAGHLRMSAEVSAGETLGPGPVEYVEERFLRYQSGLAPFEIRRTAETLIRESERWGMDRELVLAVIHTESAFNTFAISRVGALGLMQIMPPTGEMLAAELGMDWRPAMLFEPVPNVQMGTRYLAFLYDRYGSWPRALAAYNWGPLRIDTRLRTGRAIPLGYVEQVMVQLETPPRP
jgi:soluble lytic murein transglycosylase